MIFSLDNCAEILELQLKLIDAGYVIEAQELDILKSESTIHATSFYSNEEKINDREKKFNEYRTLLAECKRINHLFVFTMN